MPTPNPEHIKTLSRLINRSAFPALLSMELTDIGAGFAVFELEIEKKHMQLSGVVHGGVLASLIDTVAFWAVYYGIEDPEAWLVSVDLKLNYLAPAAAGKLFSRGRQIKIGRRLCYADAEVFDAGGKILAHGASTLLVIPNEGPPFQGSFPPKFIET